MPHPHLRNCLMERVISVQQRALPRCQGDVLQLQLSSPVGVSHKHRLYVKTCKRPEDVPPAWNRTVWAFRSAPIRFVTKTPVKKRG